jgi:hypothetical protein
MTLTVVSTSTEVETRTRKVKVTSTVLVTKTSTSVVKGCTPVPKKREVSDSEVKEGMEKRVGEELDLEGRDGYEKKLGNVMRAAMGIWMLLGAYLELTGELGNKYRL